MQDLNKKYAISDRGGGYLAEYSLKTFSNIQYSPPSKNALDEKRLFNISTKAQMQKKIQNKNTEKNAS